MEILTFIKSLRHAFSKNEIAKSCELTLDSLREHTQPAWAEAEKLFRTHKLQSQEVKNFASDFIRMVHPGDMFEIITNALQNAESLLTSIDKKSDTLFADTEANVALTYQKAAYLQLVTSITFANDYARKLLNYIYVAETASADQSVSIQGSITKAEREYVEQYFAAFCVCVKAMMLDFETIEKSINGMPDAVVTQLSEQTLPATLGSRNMDPMGLRALSIPVQVSVKWNPFYLLGTCIAAYQVSAYKASKEELDLLQMRKLNLEKIHERRPDPKLQREIEYISERVTKLNYELQKAQESFGV